MDQKQPINGVAGTETPGLTASLAQFACTLSWKRLPADVQQQARRSLVNIVGNMIAGSRDTSVDHLLAVLQRFMGPATATLVGRSEPVDVPAAAFLNAVSGNVLDFDDTHPETLIHPGACVFGASLAVGESCGLGGEEVLAAFVAGTEVAFRLGRALGAAHYDRGWHITATCGVIGAAAASAHLLRLDPERTRNAMAIAATQASGLIENLSSMAKSVGVGDAARNGVMAAYYAMAGVDGAPAALEGPRGFLQVFSDASNSALALQDLGSEWEILFNRVKPYPCCLLMHPLVDAVLDLRLQESLRREDVEEVVVRGHQLHLARSDRPQVGTGREAKLSIQFTVAVALLRGRSGVADYLDSAVGDPEIWELARHVRVVEDATVKVDWGCVQVRTKAGKQLEFLVKQGRGSVARPMKDAEVTAKTIALVQWATPHLAAQPLVEAFWTADQAPSIKALLAKTVPAPADVMAAA